LNLQPSYQHEAPAQPLASRTRIVSETELEELLLLYRKLSATERATHFRSTRSIAQTYSVPKRTVQRWVIQGRVAAVRIGGKYQVHVHSFDEYLRSCTWQSMK
jgi:excisionase family DNA binding protein